MIKKKKKLKKSQEISKNIQKKLKKEMLYYELRKAQKISSL